jgi:DNA-directed RNA polymerase subunit L/DNA-directed RNA polymerase alpha subunit
MFSDYAEFGPSLLGNPEHKLNANFRLYDTNVTVANTIRRAIVSRTPTVGFRTEPYDKSEVAISVNTTPLVNEMISHRIGMIPICVPNMLEFDPSLYEFVLDKKNTTNELMDVRASDFKVYQKNPENPLDAPIQLDTNTFFPPDPITGDTVLITRLRAQWNPTAANEQITVKARASISTGSENIRWSPVSQCSYEYTRDLNPENIQQIFNAWLAASKKIVDPSTVATDKIDVYRREFDTMEIQRCYVKDEHGNPTDFTFHLESVGVQPVTEIVNAGIAACEALVTKYQDLDAVLPDNVRIQVGDSQYSSIDVVFQNEEHTLGNLLETYLISRHVDGDAEPRISYAAYKVPHPLRPEMFVRIGMEGIDSIETQKQTARLVIASVCRHLKSMFQELRGKWKDATAA